MAILIRYKFSGVRPNFRPLIFFSAVVEESSKSPIYIYSYKDMILIDPNKYNISEHTKCDVIRTKLSQRSPT